MHLELEQLLERTGIQDHVFFEMAYKAINGKEGCIKQDVLRYQVGGIIPDYVQRFIYLKTR